MQASELLTYLLPSWAYTACQPEAATNVVDLIIFCEEPFCAILPATCRPLVNTSGLTCFDSEPFGVTCATLDPWLGKLMAAVGLEWRPHVQLLVKR